MASKPQRRRRTPVKALKIDHQVGVGALASSAIASTVLGTTVDDRIFMLSMKNQIALRDNTPGDGPLYLIAAHSDYTDAEILEWWNSQGSWDAGDKVANEQARRKCRLVGMFAGELANELLKDGQAAKTTLKFMVEDGETLNFAVINEGGATRTTGGIVEIKGMAFAKAT